MSRPGNPYTFGTDTHDQAVAWDEGYAAGLEAAKRPTAVEVGTAVHNAIEEHFFNASDETRTSLRLTELYNELWQSRRYSSPRALMLAIGIYLEEKGIK